MPKAIISKEIQAKPIEWMERSPEITQYLKEKGMKTVGEVVERQKEIPIKYLNEIKKKLIFDM